MNILVVSGNAFSRTKNNGKTLLSIFEDQITSNKNNISSLYFSNEVAEVIENSYHVSEEDFINRFRKSSQSSSSSETVNMRQKYTVKRNNSDLVSIARECIWKTKFWKTKELCSWLDKVSPDIVFFMAGPTWFTYNIVKFIVKKYGSKLYLYYTDDYYFRKRKGLSGWLYRAFSRRHIRKSIRESSQCFVIGPYMKETYDKYFGISTMLLGNIYVPKCDMVSKTFDPDNKNVMVYAGNLSLNRDKVLIEIAKCINRMSLNWEIHIYSTSAITERLIQDFDYPNVKLQPAVPPEQLYNIYNNADILVFAEAFDPLSIETTRYSLSTKVIEYLCAHRAILCVGPSEISSIDFLRDVSFVANSVEEINEAIIRMINSSDKYTSMGKLAEKKYQNLVDQYQKSKIFLSEDNF